MSTSTRKFMRGEIYYIYNFPTCGHEQRSGRPAVIVSSNEINAHSEVVEVCYLTLKEKPDFPTHIFIDIGPCINSTVLCEQITSVSTDRVGDFMCRIPEHLEEALDKAIMASLDLIPKVKVDPNTASAYQLTPQSVMDEITALNHENKVLKEELRLAKDANATLKEKCAASSANITVSKNRADMYEWMYNDLVDRLIRGGK